MEATAKDQRATIESLQASAAATAAADAADKSTEGEGGRVSEGRVVELINLVRLDLASHPFQTASHWAGAIERVW